MDYYTLEEILVNSNKCINYGYISELAILKEFIKNGFEVHIPFGNSQRYDLVIRIKDKFKKILYRRNIITRRKIVKEIWEIFFGSVRNYPYNIKIYIILN